MRKSSVRKSVRVSRKGVRSTAKDRTRVAKVPAEARRTATRNRILKGALRSLNRDGLDALSMRKLASELGVTPMAFYYYFPDKAALLDGVVDSVLSQLEPPLPSRASWERRLRAMVLSIYRLLKEHPNIVPLLARRPALSPGALRIYEATLRILRDSGLDDDTVLQAYATLYAYTLGFAAVEVGRLKSNRQRSGTSALSDLAPYLHQLPRQEFEVLIALTPRIGRFNPDQFEFGLDLVLDGLVARATRRKRR